MATSGGYRPTETEGTGSGWNCLRNPRRLSLVSRDLFVTETLVTGTSTLPSTIETRHLPETFLPQGTVPTVLSLPTSTVDTRASVDPRDKRSTSVPWWKRNPLNCVLRYLVGTNKGTRFGGVSKGRSVLVGAQDLNTSPVIVQLYFSPHPFPQGTF